VDSLAKGRFGLLGSGVWSEARHSEWPSEVLPIAQIPLLANAHPLQVNPGIGFLCALEGFSFVSGLQFLFFSVEHAFGVVQILVSQSATKAQPRDLDVRCRSSSQR
jgi:hypothetical protein